MIFFNKHLSKDRSRPVPTAFNIIVSIEELQNI